MQSVVKVFTKNEKKVFLGYLQGEKLRSSKFLQNTVFG